jgi:hypothetical protein
LARSELESVFDGLAAGKEHWLAADVALHIAGHDEAPVKDVMIHRRNELRFRPAYAQD